MVRNAKLKLVDQTDIFPFIGILGGPNCDFPNWPVVKDGRDIAERQYGSSRLTKSIRQTICAGGTWV